jgi:thioredoxin reductase
MTPSSSVVASPDSTYLARARRNVCVIDTGKPRNRFASTSHGFLGQDGNNPRQIPATAREQLQAYNTVQVTDDEAITAQIRDDGFAVFLASGETVEGNKLTLAFGLSDELPDIPGLAERWGETVLHCPYCHGIEFAGRELGVLYRTPMSVHQACLITEWGPTTLYLDGASLDEADALKLAARGVTVRAAKVRRMVGDSPALSTIELDDGHRSALAALYISPRSLLASPLADQLGVEIDDGPLGPMIRTGTDKMTCVPGVYAAGDIARAPHSVSWAVADGVTAGTSAHHALVFG